MSIIEIKVTLQDIEPAVTRTLQVPADIRLDRLHLTLQAAMGWTNSHLYMFEAARATWGIADPDFGGEDLPANKTTLGQVIEDTGKKTINYIYDFGDNWEHRIKIGRITDPVPGELYPRLIEMPARRRRGLPWLLRVPRCHGRSKASRARSSQRLVWRHLRSQSARNRQTQTRSPQSRKTLEARKTKEIRLSDRTLTGHLFQARLSLWSLQRFNFGKNIRPGLGPAIQAQRTAHKLADLPGVVKIILFDERN